LPSGQVTARPLLDWTQPVEQVAMPSKGGNRIAAVTGSAVADPAWPQW
jgi:hypothetical protein